MLPWQLCNPSAHSSTSAIQLRTQRLKTPRIFKKNQRSKRKKKKTHLDRGRREKCPGYPAVANGNRACKRKRTIRAYCGIRNSRGIDVPSFYCRCARIHSRPLRKIRLRNHGDKSIGSERRIVHHSGTVDHTQL